METFPLSDPGSTVQRISSPLAIPSIAATSLGTVVRRDLVPSQASCTLDRNSPTVLPSFQVTPLRLKNFVPRNVPTFIRPETHLIPRRIPVERLAEMMLKDERAQRGLLIVAQADANIQFLGKFHAHVRSQTPFEPGRGPLPYCEEGRKGPEGWYCIKLRDLTGICSCPDFERGNICKHLWAVRLSAQVKTAIERDLGPSTPSVVPLPSIAPCRKCGGTTVIKDGTRVCDKGKVQRFECKGCGFRFTVDDGFSRIHVQPKWVLLAFDLWVKKVSFRQTAHTLSKSLGVDVTKSTVERWVSKMARLVQKCADDAHPRTSGVWHGDETTVGVRGELLWTWNIMDHETRMWLASYISRQKDAGEARRAMRKAKRTAGGEKPDVFITDGQPAYNDALAKEFYRPPEKDTPGFQHMVILPIRKVPSEVQGQFPDGVHPGNNICERLQGTQRERTKVLRHYKRINSAQVKMDGFRGYYNFVRPHMGLGGATPASAAGAAIPRMEGASELEALIRAAARKVEREARESSVGPTLPPDAGQPGTPT